MPAYSTHVIVDGPVLLDPTHSVRVVSSLRQIIHLTVLLAFCF